MVTTSGLRDRLGEPGVACSERIPSRRESDLEGQACRRDYGYPTPNALPWPRSENGWDAKRLARLPVWPSRIPFWGGIEG